MKAVSLLYHDAVPERNFRFSGFAEAGANHYKLTFAEFEKHFAKLAQAFPGRCAESIATTNGSWDESTRPFFLTFDDGGVSAATFLDELLCRRGWVGHFFITAERIGTAGFVNREQIQALHKHGHVLGSHSWSHPLRISELPFESICDEWKRSVDLLSEIVGEPVSVAAIPGGFFSRKVVCAAAKAGIEILFTSEPVKRFVRMEGVLIPGRYSVTRATSVNEVIALSSGPNTQAQLKQLLLWNLKKPVKKLGGQSFLKLREKLLKARQSA